MSMSPVVPAIIPKDITDLSETLKKVASFTHEVQVDIVDGKFVPFTSWPYGEEEIISDLSLFTRDFVIEVDLMLLEPERVLLEYIKAGVRSVVVHLESTTNIAEIFAIKSDHDVRLGLSINNDTPLEDLLSYIHKVDYVQLMGIAKIGSQGQPFDDRVLGRIRTLVKEYPNLLVSIDGSVNHDSISKLAHAGAGRCVSGSAILKAPDPEKAHEELLSLFTIAS